MIGLDTNVLIRAFVIDDGKQTEQARRLIARECSAADPGYINSVVLAETVWVLDAVYRYRPAAIARAIAQLLNTVDIVFENREAVRTALDEYPGNTSDFADALIAPINRAAGCNVTATFDRKAAKLAGFERVR